MQRIGALSAPFPFDDIWRLHLRRRAAFAVALAAYTLSHVAISRNFANGAFCALRPSGGGDGSWIDGKSLQREVSQNLRRFEIRAKCPCLKDKTPLAQYPSLTPLKALFYKALSGFFRDHPGSSGYCNKKCLLTIMLLDPDTQAVPAASNLLRNRQ